MHRLHAASLIALLAVSAAPGQRIAVSLPKPSSTFSSRTQAALLSLASEAAVILSGEVLSVSPADGFVDIRLRIDNCIKGCASTATYTLREWSGLWSSEPARYLAGQRLLLFLTARSSSGFSAPIRGDEGIVPLRAGAFPPMLDAAGNPFPDVTGTLADFSADLTQLVALQPRASTPAGSTSVLNSQSIAANDWAGPATPLTAAMSSSTFTLTTVLTLLTGASNAPQ